MNSFYSNEELAQLGLGSYGKDVLISRKTSIYKPEQIFLGNHIRIEDFAILIGPIQMGSRVHIAANVLLRSSEKFPITLEDATGLAPGVNVISTSDDYKGPFLFGPHFPAKLRNNKGGPVTIKRFVVVGINTLILPNVTLGEGSSIGAMSMVCRNTKPWKVYFGVPARPIFVRDSSIIDIYNDFIENEGM